jgi:WD40 repeat protein
MTLEIAAETYVQEISWYASDESCKYILVGLSDGNCSLIDIIQNLTIIKFEKYGTAITKVIWLKFEPGTFVTLTKGTGRAAYWNVSKKNHNELVKYSESPIISCIDLPGDPTKILMSLENGSIVVFDIKYKKNVFLLQPAHSETIFDLAYSPLEYGKFATCSFDATIKIWDLKKDQIISNLRTDMIQNLEKKKSGIGVEEERITIYCLKWSCTSKEFIASGDARGHVKIWDVGKTKLVSSLKLNSGQDPHIVGIDWNNSDFLLSCCLDSIFLLKFEALKLTLISSLKVGVMGYQIKFDPFNDKSCAVGCHDSTIKIYQTSFDNKTPLKNLTGHSKKVFGLSYNPLRKGILASTSDDSKVGIWDLENNTNFLLSGHTDNTRQAVWLIEVPDILLTGSWDGTVRIWDIQLKSCLFTINEHYSDVYGLSISPNHPFLLTSSSRDNSIRFWDISPCARDLINYVINFENLQKTNTSYKGLEASLVGKKSKIEFAEAISCFFLV